MTSSKQATVAVVGLGYVGLPVAALAAQRGHTVIGIDIDEQKVAAIKAHRPVSTDTALTKQLKQHPIVATTDPALVAKAQYIIVAVPTPVTEDNSPDLRPLKQALKDLLPHLSPGQVLIIESTINPGVMDEVVIPLLATRNDLALDAHKPKEPSLHLVHCPERINPGDDTWTVRTIPRVLGGYTSAGTKLAQDFYRSILDAEVTIMNSVTEAEAVKIMENTFRDINIAFINEMAKSFDKLGIDITKVIAGASSKPFAFMPHYPGNGVGGHCISVDPYYMIERGRQVGFDHEFLKLARQINDSMPAYTVSLLNTALSEHKLIPEQTTVALLGLAYKKNIDDVRESPALTILDLLQDSPVALEVFDPYVPSRSTIGSVPEALRQADVVMLACDHDEIVRLLTPAALAQAGITIVIDGKNALDAEGIAAAGISYRGIGRRRSAVLASKPQTASTPSSTRPSGFKR